MKPHKFLEDTPDNGTVTLPRNLVDESKLIRYLGCLSNPYFFSLFAMF